MNKEDILKKEDILARARRENKDEREEQVVANAYRYGWMGVTAVMLFLIIWRSYHHESTTDIIMILMAQIVATSIYEYVKMPEKKVYIAIITGGLIAFGLGLAALLSQYGVF